MQSISYTICYKKLIKHVNLALVLSTLTHCSDLKNLTLPSPDVHKDPDYERRVADYTAAFQGMDQDGDGTITFEVGTGTWRT